jgi:hypothetical protein
MDEILTHSLVATVAYALLANKDVPGLSTEASTRYEQHANFWIDYLTEHFEAKWRDRKGVSTGPFMDKDLTHAYTHWTRYHAYMHLLTGEAWYLTEAGRRAPLISDLMVEVGGGTAFVWDHRMVLDTTHATWGCQVFYYAYSTAIGVLDLSLEGIGPFDDAFLAKMAGTVTQNIVDNGITDFAPDVCGGVAMGGLAASGYERFAQGRWLENPFAALGPWDGTSVLIDTTAGVYDAIETTPDAPRNANPAIAMTFALLGR